MLTYFKMKNFASFRDEVEISFKAGKSAPNNDLFCTLPNNQKISKVLAILGANASGKSNLLKGLVFLRWFMLFSFKELDRGEPLKSAFFPFLFLKNKEEINTNFEIEVFTKGVFYKYFIEVDGKRVIKEELDYKPEKSYRNIYKRLWDGKKDNISFKLQSQKLEDNLKENLVRPNSTVMSALYLIEHKFYKNFYDFMESSTSNITSFIGRDERNISRKIRDAFDYLDENKSIREIVESILVGSDLGLTGMRKKLIQYEDEKDAVKGYVPIGIHHIAGNPYELNFDFESEGTKNYLWLLSKIIPVLHNGGVAIIDELESNLHPLMISYILDLFSKSSTNKCNAQLFCATHSAEILNELDKTQVVLVEKDKNGVSDAWSLDEVKGVRRNENYYAKYLTGVYGGIPKL